jgi:BRCA1/BRCA2-containing complex subunit 3
VVPGHSLAKVDFPLSSLVNLQKILFDEEKAAYNQAILQSTRFDDLHDESALGLLI